MSDHDEKKEHGSEGHGGGGHGGGHGGGGGHAEGEHEGAPEWLISFADNVALMMGFFVILLAMNMGPKATAIQGGEPSESNASEAAAARQADFIIALRNGFNSPIDMNSSNPHEAWLRKHIRNKVADPGDRDGPQGKNPQQQSLRDTGFSTLGSALISFEDQSSLLTSSAQATITQSADHFRDQKWIVELRGHVSPWESGKNPEASFKLSFDRAMSVARELAKNGVSWDQLRPVACGDSDRLVGRSDNHADDRRNQRVEIVVTKDQLPTDPYAKTE